MEKARSLPLISVIVPIYKVEPYIQKCIESIIAQTYENLEIILVDDGSPDNCPTICDEYAIKDGRIKVIHKENGGLSDARNVGIQESRGEFISFVDSDDHIDTKMIAIMYDKLIADDSDLCICNINNVDEIGEPVEKLNHESQMQNEICNKKTILSRLCNLGGWYYVTAWNKLYRRKLFDTLRFPVGKYHEDEFIIHHLLNQCEKITCIDNRLYNYVQRSGSIMHSILPERKLNRIEFKLDRTSFFVNNGFFSDALISLDNIVDTIYDNSLSAELNQTEFVNKLTEFKQNANSIYILLSKNIPIPFKKKMKFMLFFKMPRLYNIVIKKMYSK